MGKNRTKGMVGRCYNPVGNDADMNEKIVVGLSGGVDSSFAAAYLKENGYDVTGVMLNLWTTPEQEELNRCCSEDSVSLARQVASILEIPFLFVDVRSIFRQAVVEYFINGYNSGITPNPCVFCNARFRWRVLLEQANLVGAKKVATGHYARLEHFRDSVSLMQGLDPQKDQSYVLSMLPAEYLKKTVLPLGAFEKKFVRQKCQEWGLPTASRKDSQDVCFIGDMDYRMFLQRYSTNKGRPGKIIHMNGDELGVHKGLVEYTVGQRKGLRIAYSCPLYVLMKDMESNTLIVGPKSELQKHQFLVKDMNWIIPQKNNILDGLSVKVRYSSHKISSIIKIRDDGMLEVSLKQPTTEISSGQVAAIYADDVCLGGGIIV